MPVVVVVVMIIMMMMVMVMIMIYCPICGGPYQVKNCQNEVLS